MIDFLGDVFSADGFMPHGMCYLWRPGVLWLHVVSDALITLAYFSIPFTLLYFVRKRRDLEFNWMFVCFAIFIVACGTTHAMEIWVIWHPAYWTSGVVKAITALASVPTAILLVKLIPDALRLPSPSTLQQANAGLAREIAERKRAEDDVRQLNEQLERRVAERTQELESANRELLMEARERQRAEQQLRASESRVRAIVDSALSAVVVMNADGRIIDWNSRAATLFGWTHAEALGRSLAETIVPLRHREAHVNGIKHFLATGEGPVFNRLLELSAVRRDGSEFPVELSISPLENGGEITFCGFITDITERKRAEGAVRSSERLLQAIIDNSTAVVYVKDVECRYLLVNRRFEELFHVTRDWVVGRTDYDIFSTDVAAAFRAVDEQVLTGGTPMEMEEVAPLDDGLHTYVSSKCSLYDSEGKLYGLCGISADITERKRSEHKQQQQLRQLELLNRITHAVGERQDLASILQVAINSLEDYLPIDFGCAFSYDASTTTLIVTSVGTRSSARALQLSVTPHARLPVGVNGLSRCMQGQLIYEPDLRELPLQLPRELAGSGLYSMVAVPLLAEGKVFGVLLAARQQANSFDSGDCEFLRQLCDHVGLAAHQAKLYGELQQAYDELRRSQQTVLQQERLRALGQMASGVAHDINNAISPIGLYTDSLLEREPNLSDRARNYLVTIRRAIEDVAQTVGRMREFYRPREPQFNLAPVHLNRIVEQVVELTRIRWSNEPQERGMVIELVTELASDLPLIMGAESEIRDALTNLVFNAVDAMPDGGTLTLRTRAAAKAGTSDGAGIVSLEVSDTGAGMDETTRHHCLDPFFTTKGERGSGLGLAMVYGMVQRHSAELQIDSALGNGTTARLLFSEAPAAAKISEPPTPSLSSRALHILVIDDDPLIIESVRSILEHDGHRITTADGGQAGIDTFIEAQKNKDRVDAVITDLGMPHVDGRRVAMAIKAASPATPIILMTGWGQRLTAENDVPAHVDHVLNKPPKLAQLRAVLTELGKN